MDWVLLLVVLVWLLVGVFVVALAVVAGRADRAADWALTVRFSREPERSWAEMTALERGLEDGSVVRIRPRGGERGRAA